MTDSGSSEARPADRVLIFRLGGGRFGIRLAEVGEVLRLDRAPLPVPGAPAWLAGILNHHGHVVPVLRLDGVLGVAPSTGEQAIHVDLGGEPAALLVDGVDCLESVRPEGPNLQGRQRAWHGDRLLELLTVPELLRAAGV